MPGGIPTLRRPSWRPSTEQGDGGGEPVTVRRSTPREFDTAVDIATASGVFAIPFSAVDLGTGLTASRLYRPIAGASVVAAQVPFVPAFRGYVGALSLSATVAKSAGTATFEVYIADQATGAKLTWSNVATESTTFQKARYGFSPGQSIDIRVTTDGSFAPTTVDVLVEAWLIATSEAPTI